MSKRQHTKKNTNKNRFVAWAMKNWVSIVTILIAAISLGISFQANRLTKENSSPFLKIANEAFEAETLMILGCQHENYYYVSYYVANEYTFANAGGRAVSLVKIRLKRGDDEYKVKVYPPQSFDARGIETPWDLDAYHGLVFTESLATSIIVPTKAEPIELPINIDSGTGEKWLFQGDKLILFENIDEAKQAITNAEDGKDLFSWEFQFSDGSVVKNDKFIVSYSYSNTSLNFPIC